MDVVLMPDFFLDHFVYVRAPLEEFVEKLRSTAERGGGNIPAEQELFHGGNATNCAAALSKLGVRVALICRTSRLGKHLLEYFLPNVDLSYVMTDGELQTTVAIECEFAGRSVNLMISTPTLELGPEHLTERHWEAIRRAKVVGLFNWNLNRRGTELFEAVLRVRRAYVDLGDPRVKIHELPRLVKCLSRAEILSVNENEATLIAKALGFEVKTADLIEGGRVAARFVSRELGIEVDLHTPKFSAAYVDGSEVIVSTFRLPKVTRVTGAGDAWNAGNIFGILLGLGPQERLRLANAVAGFYVMTGRHPTLDDLRKAFGINITREA